MFSFCHQVKLKWSFWILYGEITLFLPLDYIYSDPLSVYVSFTEIETTLKADDVPLMVMFMTFLHKTLTLPWVLMKCQICILVITVQHYSTAELSIFLLFCFHFLMKIAFFLLFQFYILCSHLCFLSSLCSGVLISNSAYLDGGSGGGLFLLRWIFPFTCYCMHAKCEGLLQSQHHNEVSVHFCYACPGILASSGALC